MAELRPPVKRNDDIDLYIDTLGSNGQGIGRADGYAVFVPGALPGEYVKVHIIKAGASFGVGKLLQVNKSAADRIRPDCETFDRCGGCSLQHQQYKAQLESKREQVVSAFERLGGFKGVTVLPTIGMEKPWRYRNKGIFPFGEGQSGIELGFFAEHSHRLIPLDDCLIVDKEIVTAMRAIKQWANEYHVSAYDEIRHTGILRQALIRTTTTGECMVVIITTGKLPHEGELVEILQTAVGSLTSVIHNINKQDTNVILGKEFRLVWGAEKLREEIAGLEFGISAESFMQVNSVQTGKLYSTALKYAELSKEDTVIDVYCGIGTISLLLARQAKHVIGIESNKQAVLDADSNAEANGIKNVQFICGKAEEELPKLVGAGIRPQVVTLDPPRGGCEAGLLEAVAASGVPRVVYISCNPATLARDAKFLAAAGYELIEAQPVDMFPHTTHVECCCLLTREKQEGLKKA